MTREDQNFNKNAMKYKKQYPDEFTIGPNNTLFCNLCCKNINYDRKSTIDKHRAGKNTKET
jgi:hypothetical protein